MPCLPPFKQAIPNGRGSCTGSQVLLELILNGHAPRAIVLRQPDMILALGVIVAQELFGLSIPLVSVGRDGFGSIRGRSHASVDGKKVQLADSIDTLPPLTQRFSSPEHLLKEAALSLTPEEHSMLDGRAGEAKQVAMRILLRVGAIDGATALIPINQAHIDAVTYIGPG